MMTEPKVIREFFEQNLPSNIKSVVDFTTIQPQKESYVDDKLRLQITDMLYSAEFNNKPGYLYLLVEHQSTPDKLMAFRVLKYMISIMEHHIHKTGTDRLPIVYPIIFYTGSKNYNHSTNLFDLFGNKELAQDILWQPYRLIDLSKIPDEKLKEFLRYGVIARTMKHIYQKDFLPALKNIIGDLKAIEGLGEMNYIYTILSYIIEAGEIPDRKEFIKTIKTGLMTVDEEKVMTLAEQFRQEGRQEGLQEGKQEGLKLAEQFKQDALQEGLQKGKQEGKAEGKAEGKQEGKAEALKAVAMKLFSQGMTIHQVATVTGLSVWDIEELKSKAPVDRVRGA
jgi:predicted transposase/invertase (TIGR01784 family)